MLDQTIKTTKKNMKIKVEIEGFGANIVAENNDDFLDNCTNEKDVLIDWFSTLLSAANICNTEEQQ